MERKERLEKILNKNIGNPNHDKEGKFTFAPYKKYPGLQQSVKKLITIKKAEKCLTEKYLKAVDEEREKLFKKYNQDKELEDDELSRWNDGWYMWDEKDKVSFSDIDIALSKAIFKESKQDIDVYRTQIDSKNPGKMSKAEYASWSPDLEYVCKWARFLAGYDSKIDIFKNKPTLENIKIIPDVLYSQRFLRNKAKYQEYILENKSSIEAFEHGLSRHDVYEKYINSIDLISKDSVQFDFYIKYNGGPGSGNFNPGQGRGIGKPANGSNKYKFTKDSTKEELSDIKMKLINEFLLKKEKILNGAKDPQAIKEGIVDKNSIPATKEQMDKVNKLSDELSKTIQELESKYYKAKDNFTEPGFYKDSAGNIYEIVPEWGKEDYSYDEEYQKMFPVDAPRTRENTFFVYKNQKLEKASDLDVVKSIREGMTLKGISKQEERVIKSYTYATPQNTELRKGTDINEIPSAKILKDVIDRTKSEKGTFYRGFRTKEGAKDLLNLKVGDIYQDKGFMSTDRTEEIAKDFSASKILLEIENNKTKFGTNLSVSSYSMHPEESEVLFNAGTKMKIKEILEKDGFTIYKVEVI